MDATAKLSDTERLILQKYARNQEGFHSKMGPGWFRWGVERAPGHDPWELDAFRPLVARGLLEFQEDWKHYYVKLTDAAWAALSTTPVASA